MQEDALREALTALENVRLENVRLRRRVLDLIYNLDEENMPAVIERIKRAERAIEEEIARTSLLFDTDGEGAAVIKGDVLVDTINGEGAALTPASVSLSDSETESESEMTPEELFLRHTEAHLPRTYVYESSLIPALLEMKADDGGSVSGGDKLTLSPRTLRMPYLRRYPQSSTSGLYPLYVDKDGNVVAAYP